MFNLRIMSVWATLLGGTAWDTQTDATYLRSSKWKSKLHFQWDFQDNFLCQSTFCFLQLTQFGFR